MYTRKIEKDTATQVNTDKIGVLVHPATYPPIVTVDDIVVDFKYRTATVSSFVPYQTSGSTQTALAIEETNGGVFYWAGEALNYNGDTYFKWVLFSGSEWSELWSTSNLQEVGDLLYTLELVSADPETYTITQVSAIKSVFNVDGTFLGTDAETYYNSNYQDFGISGSFLVDKTTGDKVGYITSVDEHTDANVVFDKGTESEYQAWTNSIYVSSGFGVISLYTETDEPAVGDTALFDTSDEGFYPQVVKSIDTTSTPVDPDPVECTVSYSVDGETWTDVDTVLTDDNNVICNIPKYVYLRFSQDVEITEE